MRLLLFVVVLDFEGCIFLLNFILSTHVSIKVINIKIKIVIIFEKTRFEREEPVRTDFRLLAPSSQIRGAWTGFVDSRQVTSSAIHQLDLGF